MEWKEFKESKLEYPEKIIQNLITGFNDATRGLATLSILPLSDTSRITSYLGTHFQFGLVLLSQNVEGYRFKVFQFGYDVELSTVRLTIEDHIHKEMFDRFPAYNEVLSYNNDESFIKIIELVFKTKRFNTLVEGLMKVALKGKSNK
jgi:hypothetical protein